MDRAKEERENESYRSRESYRSSFFVVNYPRYGVFTEEWKKNYIFNLDTIAWILWKIGNWDDRSVGLWKRNVFFFIFRSVSRRRGIFRYEKYVSNTRGSIVEILLT